jgi:hypothetical protein
VYANLFHRLYEKISLLSDHICNEKNLRLLNLLERFICNNFQPLDHKMLLPLFQIVSRFGFSRFIAFPMHLDIHYVQIHSKNYVSRNAKTTCNLKRWQYLLSEIASSYVS